MVPPSTSLFRPIKFVGVELSQPIPTFENLERYGELKALVLLHETPIGYVQLHVTNGRCIANALMTAILEKHSWSIINHLIEDGLTAPPQPGGPCLSDLVSVRHPAYCGPFPLVTVAICTRDRTEDLARCIDALNRLDYPALDLLIVDNAPITDTTEQLVRTHYPNIRYMRETRPGLSWARNRAIAEAHGEIIAFTDDDVVVSPGWIKSLAQVFAEDHQVMAVTGFVAPFELETASQILFEYQGGFGKGFERKYFRVDREGRTARLNYRGTGQFGTGANMAFRLRLFDQIGRFDTALGVGTPTQGGEDLEIFFRLLHAGHLLVYDPSALVYHRHRRDYESLRYQLASTGMALAAYHFRSVLAYPSQVLSFLKLHTWWLWERYFKRLLQSLTRPHRFPSDLILAELVGYLTGFSRYLAARRIAASLSQDTSKAL